MDEKQSFGRVVVALLIALAGCLVIWVVVPYNNFAFVKPGVDNTYLSDSYLPEIVIALVLLLVLLVNPLLRLLGRQWVLDRRQLALIGSLLIFAAIIPSNGLMRMFPRFVAEMNQGFNTNVTHSRIVADSDFRQELFPDPLPIRQEDSTVKTFETPVSDQFIDELDPGAKVPWSSWVGPIATWGIFIIGLWMMMLGLGGVVFPQWRDRERLPFPLLNVYQALTGTGAERSDRTLPAVFYSKPLWVACGAVFLIHALRGLNEFTHAVPSIPISWDLTDYFTEGIMRHATGTLKRHSIFFSIVGVAYFIPNRYAISVWGWIVLFAIYATFGSAYIPAFDGGAQVSGMAFGSLLAIAAWTLWLGRGHWVLVGRAMLGRDRGTPENSRDRIAGWMFAIGCTVMICWLYWAGCALWWCFLATGGAATIALLMARIIAETGVPVLWMNRFQISDLAALFPLTWQSPNTLLFTGVFYALVTRASGVSAAVMATLAIGVDREASAKRQSRLLLGGLVVLVLGLVVCGAVHLNMGYHSAEITTQAKTGAGALDAWAGIDRASYEFFTRGRLYQGMGLVMGLAMLWACGRFVAWPLHPVGIMFCFFSIGNLIWFSIFLGWLLKVSITKLVGGGAYRKARPVFLGMILGELLAIIVWALVPVIIHLVTGADPAEIARYSVFRYP